LKYQSLARLCLHAQFARLFFAQFFLLLYEIPKIPFTAGQHIELLRSRGLHVPNEGRAIKYLNNIGYFRLTGYMYHLQINDGSHKFLDNITFNDIVLYYQFDKKLRALVLEYLERIEVALRARLTNSFSIKYGFYWFTQYDLYDDKTVYSSINEEIKERFDDPQERFLKSFKFKYSSERLPPSNMAMEILTLGKLSRLYKGLSNKDEKTTVASEFGLPSTLLSSWLIYLTNVRNICAHHSRLWNRKITADRPIIPTRKKYKFNGRLPNDFNTTIYGVVSMIDKLLSKINAGNTFIDQVANLIKDYPTINTSLMGFPNDWKINATWKSRPIDDEI
jgi:abortive infection bacteriophage resistance protein